MAKKIKILRRKLFEADNQETSVEPTGTPADNTPSTDTPSADNTTQEPNDA